MTKTSKIALAALAAATCLTAASANAALITQWQVNVANSWTAATFIDPPGTNPGDTTARPAMEALEFRPDGDATQAPVPRFHRADGAANLGICQPHGRQDIPETERKRKVGSLQAAAARAGSSPSPSLSITP